MKSRFIKICIFIFLIFYGISCTTLKQKVQGATDSIVSITQKSPITALKKAIKATKNGIVSIAQKSPITRNEQDQDFQFAQNQFNRQDFAAAEFYLKKSLANRPGDLRALNLLPWTYFFQKRYDKAVIAFSQAHTFDKKNPILLIGMGWCYFSLKHYEKALEHFDRAEILMPDTYEGHKGRAFVYLEQKREDLAKQELIQIFDGNKIENIITMWNQWKHSNSDTMWQIVPSGAESISIFTLPDESPRYRSILLGLPVKKETSELETAWKAYYQRKYTKAMNLFEALSLNKNPDLDSVNGLAWSLLKAKKVNQSEKVFKEILELYPKFIGAIKGLITIREIKKQQASYAQYYLDLGKYRLAKEKLDELLFKYENWAHPYNQHGKISLARQEYDLAKTYFLEALEKEPNNPIALNGLEQIIKAVDKHLYKADEALKQGDYKTAALIYYDYVQEDVNWPSEKFHIAHAYNGLGWSQYKKKQYGYAIQKFIKSVRHEDYKIDASKGLGLSLYAINEFRDAIPYLETALSHDPGNKELAYKLDWAILQSENPQIAKIYFEKILKEHPLLASPYMALGWVHYKNRNQDLAIEYFLKAISLDPDFALTQKFIELIEKERFGWQVYNSLGWTYFQNGKINKSMAMFKKSLKMQPHRSEARKGLGYINYQLGYLQEAEKMFKHCLTLNPKPKPVFELITGKNAIGPFKLQTTPLTKLGRIHLINGDSQKAIDHFMNELKMRPDQPDAYDGLGWAYLAQKRELEARAAFKMAIRL
ncbi:MAG: tetratricopeptide repeat protein, partial [Nitrospinota bacterium]|nr:tetratricopeptide repeat protein [Nitrospinota bacterium]